MSRILRFSFVLFCTIGLAATIASTKPDEKARRIVVMIDHDRHGFTYTVNSNKVQDLLVALSNLKEDGSEAEVVLLVHHRVTLAMVSDMIGILSKAGYVAPPRIFVFDSNKIAMNELSFTYYPRIPFSATADVPSKK
jgi:hypothetical protein